MELQGGFRSEVAEAIAGARLRTLSSLLDKSFLQRSADGRYDLHAITRQYAAEKPDVPIHIHSFASKLKCTASTCSR